MTRGSVARAMRVDALREEVTEQAEGGGWVKIESEVDALTRVGSTFKSEAMFTLLY
jgi:hypothetical protein